MQEIANKKCYHCGKPAELIVYDEICEDVVHKCKKCHHEIEWFSWKIIGIVVTLGLLVAFLTQTHR